MALQGAYHSPGRHFAPWAILVSPGIRNHDNAKWMAQAMVKAPDDLQAFQIPPIN